MRRMHADHREQDNHRFFVPYSIAVRNHLRPADPNANIFRFVNHNGTVLGLPGLANGTEVTLVALGPNKPTVVMACSKSHNWFTALAQRWHVQVVTITLQDDLLSQHGENLAKHAINQIERHVIFCWTLHGRIIMLIQNKQLEFLKLFKVFSQLKRHAESKKAAILFELPKGCEYWNDERLRKQIKNGESHEFDRCRYGLKTSWSEPGFTLHIQRLR